MKSIFILVLTIIASFLPYTISSADTNLEGVSGLINTPDGTVTEDGLVSVGFGVNFNFTNHKTFAGLEQYNHFFNVGFLPRFEIAGRIYRYPDYTDPNVPRYGDYKGREISLKFQAHEETNKYPALAIGALDLGGEVRHEEAYYAVTQKTLFNSLKLNLGVGTDKLEGIFGGAEWTPNKYISLIGEYDTQGFNAGVRVRPLDWLTLSAASLDSNEIGWSITTNFNLNNLKKDEEIEPSQPIVRFAPKGGQADPRLLAEILTEYGYENVRVFTADNELIVSYENRMKILEERALGVVLTLSCMHAPESSTIVRAITNIDNIPHINTVVPVDEYLAFVRGEISEDQFKPSVAVDYHHNIDFSNVSEIYNPSRYKIDLFFSPGFGFQWGRPFEPFSQRVTLQLEPEIELGNGFFVKGRTSYVVSNNLNNIDGFNVERAYIGFGGRTGSFSWLAKGGQLGLDQYGSQFEGEFDLKSFDDTVGGNFSYIYDEAFDSDYLQALGKLEKRISDYDFTARLHAGQFQYEDGGFNVELLRQFGPVELSFFYYKTGEQSGDEGGIYFRIPLPFYIDGPPNKVRTGISPDWPFTYRTEDIANGFINSSGLDLRRYRDNLYPDYILNHLADLRFSRWLID